MNDALHAATFFIIFAVALFIYGGAIYATGDKSLLPLRAQLSIRGPEDVKRVGLITARVGLVIGVLAFIVRLLVSRS